MTRLRSHTGDAVPEHPTSCLVLASQSPRRRRLLAWLGLEFSATAVDTPEDLDSPLASNPSALAESLAAEKAEAALTEGVADGALVVCFDTIVVLDDAVLGKPADLPEAWRMLRALSGRTHQVVTGVALGTPGSSALRTFSVTTNVTMKPLSDCQIEAWMAIGEFMGCAGAYNIEGQVAEVTSDECYQNVAGLPLCHLYAELLREAEDGRLASPLGRLPTSPIRACDSALGRTCALGPRLVAQADSQAPGGDLTR
jgi:septum formation protein